MGISMSGCEKALSKMECVQITLPCQKWKLFPCLLLPLVMKNSLIPDKDSAKLFFFSFLLMNFLKDLTMLHVGPCQDHHK